MHPQLITVARELEAASSRLRSLYDGADDATWRHDPGDGSWTIAECVEHLNLTSEAMLPGIEEGIAAAAARGGTVPARMRRDPIGWILYLSSRPGFRMKVRTGTRFEPGSLEEREALVARFESLQARVGELLRAADGVPIHSKKIRSPFDPRIRYSVYSAFTVLATHELRHLQQAERVLEAIGGGRAGIEG